MLPFFDASVIDGVICEVDTKIDELVIASFCTVEFGVFGIKLVIVLEIVDGIQGIFFVFPTFKKIGDGNLQSV